MQHSDTLFDEIRNIGLIDRGLRIAVGAVAILAVLASQNTGMLGWVALIPLFAVYPIMTGLIAYDPFYAWLGINTHRSSVISDEQLMRFVSKITAEEKPSIKKDNNDDTQNGKNHRDAA
ncbi:YgaP family membrane protein [Kaarinaea lacus]